MDGDLNGLIQSVLSDPEQMAQITKLAQGLMGEGAPPEAPAQEKPPREDGSGLLSSLGKAFSGDRERSRSTALLMAMRPYMRPEKQEKLDRAMKLARMVSVVGTVMRQYGGG